MADQLITARTLTRGQASAEVQVLDEPLSLWGGIDLDSGLICQVSHPQTGQSIKDKIMVMTGGRGSSSSSSVLLEAARRGTAPAAIVMQRSDTILAIGALVAAELYQVCIPIVLVTDEHDWQQVRASRSMTIDASIDGARLSIRRD